MKGETIKAATERWVGEFNAFPQDMIKKLMEADPEDWWEVTPPAEGDRVYVYDLPCGAHENGEIIEVREGGRRPYVIETDEHEVIHRSREEFEVLYDYPLPIWGTFWQFDDSADDWWLEEKGGLQKMADCGFRIFESNDYGYFFGIDGAGYDFYEAHWIPLYKARGLRWHDPETEKETA